MAGIGEQTKKRIIEGVEALFESYQGIIESTYLKCEKDLKISFPVALSPGDKPDDIAVEVEISFSTGKVKDKISLVANERQTNLIDMLEGDPNVESVTLSSGDKSVTLFEKEKP